MVVDIVSSFLGFCIYILVSFAISLVQFIWFFVDIVIQVFAKNADTLELVFIPFVIFSLITVIIYLLKKL